MKLKLSGYAYQFGVAANLVTQVLNDKDMVLIFDTIVNERIDSFDDGQDMDEDEDGVAQSSISFEEFKKSIVRIASLLTVATIEVPANETWSQDHEHVLLDKNEVHDNFGGDVPTYD